MLLVTTDGRKAALDLRLHNPSLPDHPDSKVNQAVGQIERIWRETAHNRSAQLVFCDLSIPTGGRGFSVYEDMRDKLIARGIPPSEIQFIQDHDSDDAKLQLFRDVRAGKVRILFGSTQKMGTGANVQERLIALHHLDAPWRPADVEQREGRILRQGNTNPEVQVFRYVTEQSFDAYMWQTLETKARFIGHLRRLPLLFNRVKRHVEKDVMHMHMRIGKSVHRPRRQMDVLRRHQVARDPVKVLAFLANPRSHQFFRRRHCRGPRRAHRLNQSLVARVGIRQRHALGRPERVVLRQPPTIPRDRRQRLAVCG
jgi:hypothetical protein